MKKLFLTSSVNEVAHDLVKHCDLSKGNRLVFIDTAAEGEKGDKQWLRNDRQALVDAGFEVTDYTITGKKKEQLEKDLASYNCIYMSGGNTLYLLQESQKSGFIDLVEKFVEGGKTYIGTSAGSIITGPKCPDYLLEQNETENVVKQTGYNLVNFGIIPHWGSPYFRELYLEKRLEIAYTDTQIPLIVLTDYQYVLVEGETFKIVDTMIER